MVSFFFSHWEKNFPHFCVSNSNHMFHQVFKSQFFCILMSPEWCGIPSVLRKQFESSTDKLPMYLVYKKKSSLDYSSQSTMLQRCAVEIKEFHVIWINQENSCFQMVSFHSKISFKASTWDFTTHSCQFSLWDQQADWEPVPIIGNPQELYEFNKLKSKIFTLILKFHFLVDAH